MFKFIWLLKMIVMAKRENRKLSQRNDRLSLHYKEAEQRYEQARHECRLKAEEIDVLTMSVEGLTGVIERDRSRVAAEKAIAVMQAAQAVAPKTK